ncbi:MAG: hypothetical protein DIU63_02330 [Proteobacteria bacterium]|nr:MAG: hypothetical protein DIU63_02330 [Pseudomonadota bacterium]
MNRRVVTSILFLACTSWPAWADMPAIKASPSNQVAACATPGRLMAFVKARNPALDPRFENVATEYMRHGEELGVRWDYAFFQMLLETGNLSFRRGNGQPGIVRPEQNNFAGLGAAGRGQRGESFPDISSGVKAHLQHLLLYAGERIDNPVAERTRKVQEWGILTSWQNSIKRPITFTDLAKKWAPGDRRYSAKIAAIADAFYQDTCRRPDPRPELVAQARAGRSGSSMMAASFNSTKAKSSGSVLGKQAADGARIETTTRSSLGAASIAGKNPVGNGKIVPPAGRDTAISDAWVSGEPKAEQSSIVHTAAAASSAAAAAKAAPQPKCRVWTASYGGQKAVIIKAKGEDGSINYTVLDVNEGSEKREMEAYIAAYAKGGVAIGEFSNQISALDRAFELCPEG